MGQLVVEGWLLGLSTGPYCLAACAPFMVPYLFSQGNKSWQENLRIIYQFLLGRFIAYVIFGALVGLLGQLLRPHLTQRITSIALAVTAALILLYALNRSLPRWRICAPRWTSRMAIARFPIVLGFLIGINVCPPFLAGVARLLQVGETASGAIFFLAFFAGTSIYILPLMFLSPFTRIERLQHIGTLSAILVGCWFLFAALTGL